jgi:hypothetical protein
VAQGRSGGDLLVGGGVAMVVMLVWALVVMLV